MQQEGKGGVWSSGAGPRGSQSPREGRKAGKGVDGEESMQTTHPTQDGHEICRPLSLEDFLKKKGKIRQNKISPHTSEVIGGHF